MSKKWMRRAYRFLRYNPHKNLYFSAFFLSAYYRFHLITVPMRRIKKHIGILNEESSQEEVEDSNRLAFHIAYVVNRVCDHTPWESKCLVRALAIQYLLKKNHISSTLYLGVAKKGEHMIAHAWIRSGIYYLAGGNGKDFALVAKFKA